MLDFKKEREIQFYYLQEIENKEIIFLKKWFCFCFFLFSSFIIFFLFNFSFKYYVDLRFDIDNMFQFTFSMVILDKKIIHIRLNFIIKNNQI
jgi:hypothetical protein